MSNEQFWTDERVIEFEIFKRGLEIKHFPKEQSISESIEQFKASKQVKEWEVVEVDHIGLDRPHEQQGKCGCPIHSVKRLSDGAIFTVGDWLNDGALDMQIGSIRIEGQQCILTGSAGSINLIDAKKKRTVLFKTADGKEAFEGDEIFILSTNTWGIGSVHMPPCAPYEGTNGQFKYFSTREAAQSYVVERKPCLSLKEAASILEVNQDVEKFERLLTIVKSKL